MNVKQTILLVEDNDNDRELLWNAYRTAQFQATLQMVNDGEEAIAYLKGEGAYQNREQFPMPTVILLDLSIPKLDGFGVLTWVREQLMLKGVPIIVLTGSSQEEDIKRALELGANSYLIKPAVISELVIMICCLREWLEYDQFARLHPGLKG